MVLPTCAAEKTFSQQRLTAWEGRISPRFPGACVATESPVPTPARRRATATCAALFARQESQKPHWTDANEKTKTRTLTSMTSRWAVCPKYETQIGKTLLSSDIQTCHLRRAIFLYVTPFSPIEIYRCFGETSCRHLQGRRVSQASNQPARERYAWHFILAGYLLGLLFDPEDGSNTFFRGVSRLLPDYTASHLSLYCSHREYLTSNRPATCFLTVFKTCDYATAPLQPAWLAMGQASESWRKGPRNVDSLN
jgi:hypothetical protein